MQLNKGFYSRSGSPIETMELVLTGMPIYDSAASITLMKRLTIEDVLPKESVGTLGSWYGTMYTYTYHPDVNGVAKIPFTYREEGEFVMLRVRARNYIPFETNVSIMRSNMTMHVSMLEDLSHDLELQKLERTNDDNNGKWMGDLVAEIEDLLTEAL